MKLDRLHLKWKIFIYLLGFCGLLLVILWLFQTVFLNDMYKSIRRADMEKAIAVVEKNINSSNLDSIFQTLAEEKEIMIMETDEFKPQFKPNNEKRGRPKEEIITQEKTFTLNDGTSLSLTFHALITPVNATVATLQRQLYIITGIMIMLSILLALIIAKRVSRPIEDINKSAKHLAKGDYSTEFKGTGYLEIAELSHTLNAASYELSKVEGLRRELMANISHDLRTPLSLIYSYAEMMHDFSNEITPDQTETIMEETKRLTSLVNDVFEISQLETGTMELNLSEFNITDNLGSAIKRMEELMKKDGYIFNFIYEEEITVTADEVKIGRVFYNLLINAINYSLEEKEITVKQKSGEKTVRIEISDKGEGISEDNLPHIWDRYYKIDKNHKRAVTGSGLGLSIVKKIIELHGGSYGVESEVGEGSTFWFKLNRSIENH